MSQKKYTPFNITSMISFFTLMMVMCSSSYALKLGDFRLYSGMNEPLRAEILLEDLGSLSKSGIQVDFANRKAYAEANIDRSQFITNLSFRIVDTQNGPVVRLTSLENITDSSVTLLLEVKGSNGTQDIRQYTVSFNLKNGAATPAPVQRTAAPAVATAPVTKSVSAPTSAVAPAGAVSASLQQSNIKQQQQQAVAARLKAAQANEQRSTVKQTAKTKRNASVLPLAILMGVLAMAFLLFKWFLRFREKNKQAQELLDEQFFEHLDDESLSKVRVVSKDKSEGIQVNITEGVDKVVDDAVETAKSGKKQVKDSVDVVVNKDAKKDKPLKKKKEKKSSFFSNALKSTSNKAKETADKAKDSASSAVDAVSNVKDDVAAKAKNTADKAKDSADNALNAVTNVKDDVAAKAKEGADKAKDSAGNAVNAVGSVKDSVVTKAKETADKAKDSASNALDVAANVKDSTVSKVKDTAKGAKDGVVDAAKGAKKALDPNLDMILGSADDKLSYDRISSDDLKSEISLGLNDLDSINVSLESDANLSINAKKPSKPSVSESNVVEPGVLGAFDLTKPVKSVKASTSKLSGEAKDALNKIEIGSVPKALRADKDVAADAKESVDLELKDIAVERVQAEEALKELEIERDKKLFKALEKGDDASEHIELSDVALARDVDIEIVEKDLNNKLEIKSKPVLNEKELSLAIENSKKVDLELEQKDLALIEAGRKTAEAEADLKRLEEERELKRKQVADEAKRFDEEAAKKQADADAEAKRLEAEKAKKQAEAEAEAKRLEEERAKKQAEAEAEAKRLEEERAKKQAEIEAENKRLEEEKVRQQLEAEAELKRLEEEKAQRRAEAEAELKKLEEEKELKRSQAQAELKRIQLESEHKRKEAEEELKRIEKQETERLMALERAKQQAEQQLFEESIRRTRENTQRFEFDGIESKRSRIKEEDLVRRETIFDSVSAVDKKKILNNFDFDFKPRPFNTVLSDRTSASVDDVFKPTPEGELTQSLHSESTPQSLAGQTAVTAPENAALQVDSPSNVVNDTVQITEQPKATSSAASSAVQTPTANQTPMSSTKNVVTAAKGDGQSTLSPGDLQELINDIDQVDSLPVASQSAQAMINLQTESSKTSSVNQAVQAPVTTDVPSAPQGTASFDEDHSDIKIDLARMYLATGDVDSARSTLNAIIDEGETSKHYATAQKLLLQLY